MLFNILLKVKYRFFEFIKYDKQRTFLSRIDRSKLLKSYFHKHFTLLRCASLFNTKFCRKLSIRKLCNQNSFCCNN